MAKLIYVANVSLDGFIEDAEGQFDWGEPSDEVFSYLTDLLRPMGTYLYGRRMYETMAVWETDPSLAAQSELMAEFAHIWQAAHKIVYSTTLSEALTEQTRVERRFDPESLRAWKATAVGDVAIAGSNLAATRSRRGSSMSASCSSTRSCSAGGSRRSPPTSPCTSSSSKSAASTVAS